MNKQKLLISSALMLAGAGIATNAHAKAEWAQKFGVECTACHNSAAGSGGNVKSAAQTAYNKSGLTGLKNFLNGGTTPAPTPTVNTKPVISAVTPEWDVSAGDIVTIPLSVSDAEQDDFQIIGKFPAGSALSSEYVGSNGLPTVDFQFTPAANLANKVYTVKFTAKETATAKKLSSVPLTTKIRVWPAGDRDQVSVSKLIVSTTKWTSDTLTLKGKVVLNKLMTAAEKASFFSRTNWVVNISQGTNGSGTVISASQPVTFDGAGNWTLSNISLAGSFSCNLTVEFEGKFAARKITGAPRTCVK